MTKASIGDKEVERWIDSRQAVTYGKELQEAVTLLLPSCKPDPSDAYRFLGQMAHAVVAPPDHRISRDVRQMLRDSVRYVDVVWGVAARVVAHLGSFRFSSLHIRRNDLQYKQVFVSANRTLHNIAPLLHPGEPLYLATDEVRPQFFRALRSRHPLLYRWEDMFGQKTGHLLCGLDIPRKLVGCIEQAICAMGRRFIGTQHSTFSGATRRALRS